MEVTNKNLNVPELNWNIELKNNKPVDTWLSKVSLDERLHFYNEYLIAFDKREDEILRDDFQTQSHRLHWDEHSYCYEFRSINDNFKRLYYTLVFSFSNEHWGTITKLKDEGKEKTLHHFKTNRHARNDLFQIYYPKDTIVKEWLLNGPEIAARDLHHVFNEIELGQRRRFTMMEFAKYLETYFKEKLGFRSPLYPCKNTARYIAMTWPHLVDPESVLFGGTYHFVGLQQVFGGKCLDGKCKYEIDKDGQFVPNNKQCELWVEQMNVLSEYNKKVDGPIKRHILLQNEDKTCFFAKYLAYKIGSKKPTPKIPYTWIFSDSFNLSDNIKYLDYIKERGWMY
jgi:hypothetical protein